MFACTSSCTLATTVSKHKLDKYVLDWERTRNIDGKHYICNTCKICLKNNKEPARAQRELLGLLGFPEDFKKEIYIYKAVCSYVCLYVTLARIRGPMGPEIQKYF